MTSPPSARARRAAPSPMPAQPPITATPCPARSCAHWLETSSGRAGHGPSGGRPRRRVTGPPAVPASTEADAPVPRARLKRPRGFSSVISCVSSTSRESRGRRPRSPSPARPGGPRGRRVSAAVAAAAMERRDAITPCYAWLWHRSGIPERCVIRRDCARASPEGHIGTGAAAMARTGGIAAQAVFRIQNLSPRSSCSLASSSRWISRTRAGVVASAGLTCSMLRLVLSSYRCSPASRPRSS
jgi:hypothetical protein